MSLLPRWLQTIMLIMFFIINILMTNLNYSEYAVTISGFIATRAHKSHNRNNRISCGISGLLHIIL